MRVLISGGGTGGHVNPALAIAGEIRARNPGAKIKFVGTRHGLESRLVTKEGFDIEYIEVSGLKHSLSLKNVKLLFKAALAVKKCKSIIRDFNPDIVIGTGGYVSGPVVKAAQSLGIKTAIHEQNAFPGITTRMLSKKADKVFLSFRGVGNLSRTDNTVLTGNPVRTEITRVDKTASRRVLNLDARPMILSYGGSLGARNLNIAMADLIIKTSEDKEYIHIHGAGKRYFSLMEDILKKSGINFKKNKDIIISEYIYDMARVMAGADVVICRAGAITLAEIAILGKPAILIPSPNVTDNHQFFNAKVFADNGAAVIIEDKDLTGERLQSELNKILSEPSALREMSKNALKLAKPNALKTIADEITALVKQ